MEVSERFQVSTPQHQKCTFQDFLFPELGSVNKKVWFSKICYSVPKLNTVSRHLRKKIIEAPN